MTNVRRLVAIATILVAIPIASALAASAPSGTFVTKVSTAGKLNGTYHITFSPGHFYIHAPYGLTGHGTYTVSGSKMTLHGPGKCDSPGLYEFKLSGSSLTFKKLSDPCPRAKVLTAHALKKS
jgi:hypothetical protein